MDIFGIQKHAESLNEYFKNKNETLYNFRKKQIELVEQNTKFMNNLLESKTPWKK